MNEIEGGLYWSPQTICQSIRCSVDKDLYINLFPVFKPSQNYAPLKNQKYYVNTRSGRPDVPAFWVKCFYQILMTLGDNA